MVNFRKMIFFQGPGK